MRKFVTLAFAVAVLLGFAAATGGPLGPGATKCESDSDCKENQVCKTDFGVCMAERRKRPTFTKCDADNACPDGKECNKFNFCVDTTETEIQQLKKKFAHRRFRKHDKLPSA